MSVEIEVYEFTVTGSGTFPYDMLRYDSCWPAVEGSEGSYHLAPDQYGVRKVYMQGVGRPTPERWKSFLWVVGEITVSHRTISNKRSRVKR